MKRIAALLLVLAASLGLAGCATTQGQDGSSVVGQWGGVPANSPVLVFSGEGSFTGNDGCNTLTGSWKQADDAITLENMAATLMACAGVDTWLSHASTVKVDGTKLMVFDAQGKEIGVLAQEGNSN
ncbi:META domain-containing protein [Paeniglutamicibacter kerguelensis]|uniref:Heat shock protein HslJ n=1 Tax=Paeniglutamicibacter kerguelensis TaxID=254788 RepID=A0ABS4XAT6_9MICC|nr:META domain-containing protein [Paeniglutamicibacter kerguelensis]MBP2385486.1 heat shock protein HslJ [Paeniglutamicibacter kerguelensis]